MVSIDQRSTTGANISRRQVNPGKGGRSARVAKDPLHWEERRPQGGDIREVRLSNSMSSTSCVGKRSHNRQGDGGPNFLKKNPQQGYGEVGRVHLGRQSGWTIEPILVVDAMSCRGDCQMGWEGRAARLLRGREAAKGTQRSC